MGGITNFSKNEKAMIFDHRARLEKVFKYIFEKKFISLCKKHQYWGVSWCNGGVGFYTRDRKLINIKDRKCLRDLEKHTEEWLVNMKIDSNKCSAMWTVLSNISVRGSGRWDIDNGIQEYGAMEIKK